MILRQFLHSDPIAASYLLGCAGRAVGAVVDPVGEPDVYLRAAAEHGLRLRYVVDTHLHADHPSPARALAAAAGAEYVLHASARAAYRFRPVSEDDVLTLGNVAMRVLHTPGHTPEHLSLLVTDHTRGEEPWLLLTGHTLMVGDMGRTELAGDGEQGARALWSTAEKLRSLPDHLLLLPGAYAGSVCGRGLSANPASTLGFERRFNRALRISDETAFVRTMLEETPVRPPEAEAVRAANQGFTAGGR